MVSRKNERLVNLTIALLNTPRYLTKSEIFSKVAGYEGSAESKERMFERDKDELRAAGVTIDVQLIDPLFHDEAGYRILPQKYGIEIPGLDTTDVALMALGVRLLKTNNHDLLLRLQALGADSGEELPIMPIELPDLTPIISAIDQNSVLSFDYRDAEGAPEARKVEPYGLFARDGRWFFVGFDQSRQDFRTFRYDRIIGEINLGKKAGFSKRSEFDFHSYLMSQPTRTALVRVRKEAAWELRSHASSIQYSEDWDVLTIPFFTDEWLIEKVLWHFDSALLLEPLDIKAAVMKRLADVVKIHE